MNFLIYGAGALGQALGCMLASAGHKVDLVLRKRFLAVIETNGLNVDGVLGSFSATSGRLRAFSHVDQLQQSYDYVFITTKSYDTASAITDIVKLGEKVRAVVSLQNGCGNVEKVLQAFGSERSLGGRVITGFEITAPGHVNISVTADAIHIGGAQSGSVVPEAAVLLAEALEAAGHPCVAVEDVHQSLYAKLLYNCALNPLGAILGVHYGELADNPETKTIMDKIIRETFAVVSAIGGNTPWGNAAEYREFFYSTLIPATYNHRASMLQDLESGKPTEIDALLGFVCENGKRVGLDTLTCDLVAAMLRFKEAQNLATT